MKKKKYGHFTQYERDRLQALLDSGHKQKEVALVLKRSASSVSREIKRNRKRKHQNGQVIFGRYRATIAENKSYVRRKYSKYQGKKINENWKLEKFIVKKLIAGWSPDDISGRMKEEKLPFYTSKTAIYEWLYSIWGQRYCRYLDSRRYNSKKRKKKKSERTLIPNRIGIEMRPEEINQRIVFGHYEGDTVVSGKKTGSKEALAVIQERKAKYVCLRKIKSLRPKLFNEAILNMKNDIKKIASLTLDNGIENTKHGELGFKVYFCDPYSSWQKGGVENINGLIRRFIPKGADISVYSEEYVMMIQNTLNNKPRKSLGYRTPLEVMRENNLLK
jgi:IS30 family transposase